MTTGFETTPAVGNEGGGVESLTFADPPPTDAGAGPALPKLRLEGATTPKAARVWRCGDPVACCGGLMHDGGVACIGGVLDPIEDLLDLSEPKELQGGVLCSGAALRDSPFSVASSPASMKRAILLLSSSGEKGRPALYR